MMTTADQLTHVLRPLILQAVAGNRVDIPAVEPPCTITGAREGNACVVTVWGPPAGSWHGPVPIATVGVAPTANPRLWEELRRMAKGAAELDEPPAPWCAAVLLAGAAIHTGAMEWMGDFERCGAWTWIEKTQLYG